MRPVLEKIAAKADGIPCVQFIGNGAAGHYTKMVHNGIEYAMMQMISEVYGVLKASGYTNTSLHEFFSFCNQTLLKGYLIEITAEIFLKKDDLTDGSLIDMILDKAGQKGTGMWTSQSAFELAIPITIIDSAVSARNISALKDDRVNNSKSILIPKEELNIDRKKINQAAIESLYLGFLLCYTQGLHLLKAASLKYDYQLRIAPILDVWKGGCIIRSYMLNLFKSAYENDDYLINALSSPLVFTDIEKKLYALKEFTMIGIRLGIAIPALSNALNYCFAYSTERLPANLIQAQRDYFGAHTYERTDREGIFHTHW
jgi:6-phosphogluconate dehydrogenase